MLLLVGRLLLVQVLRVGREVLVFQVTRLELLRLLLLLLFLLELQNILTENGVEVRGLGSIMPSRSCSRAPRKWTPLSNIYTPLFKNEIIDLK